MSVEEKGDVFRRAVTEAWTDCRFEVLAAPSGIGRMVAVVRGAAALLRVLATPAAALASLSPIQDLGRNVKQATRRMQRSPGFTLVAVSTLALGIGATTAVFGMFNSVFLKTPSLPDLERLVFIYDASRPANAPKLVTFAQYRYLIDRGPAVVQRYAGTTRWHGAIAGAGRAEPVNGELVSSTYFDALGLRPQAGTLFPASSDFDAAAAIVISDRLWTAWFSRDPAAIGREVKLAGVTVTIAGVAPPDFVGLFMPTLHHADVWIPFGLGERLGSPVPGGDGRNSRLRLVARLADRVDLPAADAAVRAFGEPGEVGGLATVPVSAEALLPEDMKTMGMPVGQALTALALLVFLIACANFTGLQLARGLGRVGELSIRRACGASRMDLVRLLMTETCAVVVLGVFGGLGVAWLLTNAIAAVRLPMVEETTLRLDLAFDVRTFMFASACGLAAALVVGVMPALRASRLQGGANAERVAAVWAAGRLRRILVGSQFAAATVLLLVAGLYVRSATAGLRYHPGFETTHLATGTVDLRLHGYDETQGRRYLRDALREVADVPGVDRVAIADFLPLDIDGGNSSRLFSQPASARGKVGPRNVPGEVVGCRLIRASAGFIEMLRIPVLRGRSISDADVAGSPPVVVLSELAAAAMFPAQDPIGQRLAVSGSGGETWAEVVGVVQQTDVGDLNVRYPLAFVSIDQNHASRMSIFASGGPSAASLATLVAGALRSVDPDVAITNVGAADAQIAVFLAPVRLAAALLAVLSSIGVAIAIVGLYATVAFFVAARTREIGVRVALGATAHDVRRLVVRQGVRPVIAGGILGLAGSYVAAGLLTNLLYGIAPRDPLTFVGVPFALLLVGIAACLGPARRASLVDPNVALRHS